jgi:hypothetical protein
MSLRAQRLFDTADRQAAELAERLAAAGPSALSRACPGREKLGDGTVAAVAAHTTERYVLIARFVHAVDHGGDPPRDVHGRGYESSEIELDALLARLAAARDALAVIGELSDEQLEVVPPDGDMRFADGTRTLEQVLASLLKHQRHQVDALARAVS